MPPSVTVHVVPSSNANSILGHVYFTIDDGAGNSCSYGYYPFDHVPYWMQGVNQDGKVVKTDDKIYPEYQTVSRTWDLTQGQYDNLRQSAEQEYIQRIRGTAYVTADNVGILRAL